MKLSPFQDCRERLLGGDGRNNYAMNLELAQCNKFFK